MIIGRNPDHSVPGLSNLRTLFNFQQRNRVGTLFGLDEVNGEQHLGENSLEGVIPTCPTVKNCTFQDQAIDQNYEGRENFGFADAIA